MATNFPASLDSLTNPTASDKLNSVTVPHASQHATLNDAVEALEAKVGVNGSAVTTSHDYLIDKQSVVPYDDASARTTAVPSPIEGQMSYLKDTNSVEVYDGSAWTAVGGGVANANFTDTATGTFTVGATNYKYLIFTSSGTVTFDTDGLADFLVVAGGGGGGTWRQASIDTAGGGGAGGCLERLGFYITAGTYTVTVGAGGPGNLNWADSAVGNGSSVGTILQATGGGGGGVSTSTDTANWGSRAHGWGGGSGGGGAQGWFVDGRGGTGVDGQGFVGGYYNVGGGQGIGAGGGGWGGTGGPSGSAQPANGGPGDISTIITASIATSNSVGEVSGSDVYYGGGGVGNAKVATYDGTGGIGGGGDLATAGTANTGGGGGSSNTIDVAGGAGGSGVVIIRVAV